MLHTSLNNADYEGKLVHSEIRVDYHDSDEHSKTLAKARDFVFKHGSSSVHEDTQTQGLQYAWLGTILYNFKTRIYVLVLEYLEKEN